MESKKNTKKVFSAAKTCIACSVIVAVVVVIVVFVLHPNRKDGTAGTVTPTYTPTMTVAVTEVVTPGSTTDIDTELFWNIYNEYFPKESLKRASEKNSKESFAGRIELSREEWEKIKPNLNFDDWYLKEYQEPQKSSLYGYAEEMFVEKEWTNVVAEGYYIRHVEIPKQRAVAEHIDVMQVDNNGIVILYYAYVY